ncbi:hypothetical protein FB45DRAFT_1126839 [Roridomyces roridus]|uniref:F-box domain-containing protein n=1 Tax=Roridomyces roridus TaxID=1738132 RepID=A0AAD7F8W0_9AGAR|nr:hypothetical protein FB45DRAFT_1126839 [Roridomyces roridus]
MDSSRIAHLLACNEPPDDREISLIRGLLSEAQTRLETIQAQNSDLLNDASEDLLTELEDVVHFIRSHTGILGASRRVPAELVAEIFSHMTESRRVGKAAVPSPPWCLGHICQFWRAVALSVPSLWNSIRVYQPFLNSISRTYSSSMLEAQLLRSGDLPLDMSITWLRGDAAVQMEFWDILLANSHRWGSFYARYKIDSNIDVVLSRIRGRIPLLKEFRPRIRLFIGRPAAARNHTGQQQIQQRVPILGAPLGPDHPLSRPLDILRGAPNLVECSMGITTDFHFDDSGATAKLPRLCRLFLEPSREAARIPAHIHAPVLRDLSAGPPYRNIMPFIHRSSCQLTRLFLDDIYMWLPSPMSPMEEIIAILEQLPTLEEFGLLCSDRRVPDVWGALTVSSNRAALCPALSSVVYGWRGPQDLNYYGFEIIDSFFAMLQSRLGLNSVFVMYHVAMVADRASGFGVSDSGLSSQSFNLLGHRQNKGTCFYGPLLLHGNPSLGP